MGLDRLHRRIHLQPRATRLAATTLAALAGSDFLQFAYAYAEQHAG